MPRPKPQPNSHCFTCDAPLYRSPSKLQKHNHNYCDQNCRNHNSIVWIGFIQANHREMTVKQIAAYIGIPAPTLRTWVFGYNQWGLNISFKKGRVPRVKEPKPVKEKPAPVVKEKRIKVAKHPSAYPSNRGKPPKKEVEFKNKSIPFDPRIHKMVKVNGKTWKQVPIDNNLKTA